MATKVTKHFREPVTEDIAPDYHSVISQPMDLGTIRAKLAAGEYTSPAHANADICLVG